MQQNLPRPGKQVLETYEQYASMLFKIAVVHLGSREDAEEAIQDTFIKLMEKAPVFNDEEHRKAWLIRVLINHCKNVLGRIWRKREVSLVGIEPYCSTPEELDLMSHVLNLPVKYKTVIHLYYYEDYSIRKISETLEISESAVKMRLQRGRQCLKVELEGEEQQ